MNVNRILHIRDGDAVKTFQGFLAAWWRRVELDAMLAPVELPDHAGVSSQLITQPEDLSNVNPFIPVMLNNSASMVEDFVRDHPRGHLAVILRPCELRAWVELQKRNRIHDHRPSLGRDGERLVVIGVDCPGTFSPAEYLQQLAWQQDDAEIIRTELDYGRQDSSILRQIRAACQLCDSPCPSGADILMGTIGIAPHGDLLLVARDEITDASLKLQDVTDGLATEGQVAGRELTAAKLAGTRSQKRSELFKSQTWQTEDMNTSWAMFARCTLCADCLDACPLYDGQLRGMLGVGEASQGSHPLLSELVSVSRWLASCSGCGMCQEACEQGISLTPIITLLSHQIQAKLHYKPGDPAQRLPWTV
ncbi:MAG TPA: 4Fe-4S dicluster domain-containing protein [Anaerolineales bacterium]|nr:4Fe-4S dicluster domain-containing protein [Anaerolineales bacterium]